MIRHSEALRFVWKVANFEAQHLGASSIEPVHFFLGLLKAVDVDFMEVLKSKRMDIATLAQLASDLADVRTAFQRADVETTPVRRRLRRLISSGDLKDTGALRRSTRSRAVFRMAEALVKSGTVAPVHLFSILAESRIPEVIQVFQEFCINSDSLLEASTIIALSRLRGVTDSEIGMPARAWATTAEEFKRKGWTVVWSRSISQNLLYWNVEIERQGIRHVVHAEDISEALNALAAAISNA